MNMVSITIWKTKRIGQAMRNMNLSTSRIPINTLSQCLYTTVCSSPINLDLLHSAEGDRTRLVSKHRQQLTRRAMEQIVSSEICKPTVLKFSIIYGDYAYANFINKTCSIDLVEFWGILDREMMQWNKVVLLKNKSDDYIINLIIKKQSQWMMQDLRAEKYEFVITPLEIVTKPLTQNKKTIVIKLGETMGRCTELSSPMTLTIEALYSISSNKYCPIKGIIKLYDRLEDNNQIISCIGSFQAEEILQQKGTSLTLLKNIGSTSIKMNVMVKQLKEVKEAREKPKQQLLAQSQEDMISVSSPGQDQIEQENKSIHSHSMLQQLQKLGGIRRVNTMNLGPIYANSDITDLKSGVNLGFSKQIAMKQPTPIKLHEKALALKQYTPKDSLSHSGQPSKRPIQAGNVKLEHKLSLDSQIKQEDGFGFQETEKVQSALMLQIQSNASNEFKSNQLQPPPNITCHAESEDNSNSRRLSHSSTGNLEEVKSMSILEQKPESKRIANSAKLATNSNSKEAISPEIKMSIFSKYQKLGEVENIQNSGFHASELENSAASITNSIASLQEHQIKEIETLGELLVEERRKNLVQEKKLEKLHFKLIASKQKYMELFQHWQKWRQAAALFAQHLHKDCNGNYILESIKSKDLIAIRYSITAESEQVFTNFLSLTLENCFEYGYELSRQVASLLSIPKNKMQTQNSEINSGDLDKVLENIEVTYASNTRLLQVNRLQQCKIQELESEHRKDQLAIRQLEAQKAKSVQTVHDLQKQVEYLESQVRSLVGINSYLKEKDSRMENIISCKDETILNLKKKMEEVNSEMDRLEEQMEQSRSMANNKELMLEQMREELADKEEAIEAYRQAFGQIKKFHKTRDRSEVDIARYIQPTQQLDP